MILSDNFFQYYEYLTYYGIWMHGNSKCSIKLQYRLSKLAVDNI